ncbi:MULTISPECIES: hypothetical protein [Legionella]|uniref:Lipoprotein n=2 Tax=Legionella TaxID=445 RepID=A0A0W0S985_9GAMM|nr:MULTISPECIES: hypothetical protein [Legionella]KTC80142.1 hypothetical protein Lche_2162 [Legionella cherrii]MCL9682849.1 hypothetical protein [Legionella maioricensis]MCL9686523.1 hypothetical protein [Legionella maioricensis]
MQIQRAFKMVIALMALVSTLLFTSCASSITTANSQSNSQTAHNGYGGHNTGGLGWH